MSNRLRGHKRAPCARGCGRVVQTEGGTCGFCATGHPAPEARPELHRTEYLVACAMELQRREQQFKDALRPLETGKPALRSVP